MVDCFKPAFAAIVAFGLHSLVWAADEPDIVGLTAGLSPEQTESVLTNAGFTQTKSDILKITGTDISWTSASYYGRQRDGDGYETLTVTYTSPPSTPAVWRVKREWQRSSQSVVPFETMINSLVAKYGNPSSRRDARYGSTLVWHFNDGGQECKQHSSANAFINAGIAEVRRGGPDTALSCAGIAVDYNVQFNDSPAGPVVSRMIATLADVRARATDEAKLNAYANEILRKKQEAQMKVTSAPEL